MHRYSKLKCRVHAKWVLLGVLAHTSTWTNPGECGFINQCTYVALYPADSVTGTVKVMKH